MNKLWNLIKYTLLASLGAFIVLCLIVLFRVDASLTKIDSYVTKEVENSGFAPRPPVILVSYADGHHTFFQNQNALVQSAADKGFDEMYQFKRSNIDKEFWDKHQNILMQKRGAGYWLWKPYFILKAMEKAPKDAIIVYADSGAVFTKPISPLLKLLEDKEAIFGGDYRAIGAQVKKEVYDALGINLSAELLQSKAAQADFMIIKNTDYMQDFVRKWLKYCEQDELIMEEPLDSSRQYAIFNAHSNDQAILNALFATSKKSFVLIPKESLRTDYGFFNLHRHPHREFTTPLWLIGGMPWFASKVVWNSPLIAWIRSLFY